MSTAKESLCTRCAHREVCSLKEQFLIVQEAIDTVMIGFSDKSIVYIRDIPWIKPIELKCIHYMMR